MLRLAIIGAGRIGQVHARTLYAHPGAELVTIVDPAPGAAATVAATFGATATENVEDVYGDRSIDAVVMRSPTSCHVDQIIASVASATSTRARSR